MFFRKVSHRNKVKNEKFFARYLENGVRSKKVEEFALILLATDDQVFVTIF